MPTVFVIATDWTLRTGVRAELLELDIDALGMDSADDAGRALADNQTPTAIVLEATAGLAGNPKSRQARPHNTDRFPHRNAAASPGCRRTLPPRHHPRHRGPSPRPYRSRRPRPVKEIRRRFGNPALFPKLELLHEDY
jgi:hypothetical protein